MSLESEFDPFDIITVIVPGAVSVSTLLYVSFPQYVDEIFNSVGTILLFVFSSYITGQIIVFLGPLLLREEFVPHTTKQITSSFRPTFSFINLTTGDTAEDRPLFYEDFLNLDTNSVIISNEFKDKLSNRYEFIDIEDNSMENLQLIYSLIIVDMDETLSPSTKRTHLRREFFKYMSISLSISTIIIFVRIFGYSFVGAEYALDYIFTDAIQAIQTPLPIIRYEALMVVFVFLSTIFARASIRDHYLFDQLLIMEFIASNNEETEIR